MTESCPSIRTCAWLPVELTDRVIDYLDFRSLLVAALVAKSWTPHATARLFERVVVWGAGNAQRCMRRRLPPGSHAPMHYTAFLQLSERNPSVAMYVRELHLVFNGSGKDRDEPSSEAFGVLEAVAMFDAFTRLCTSGQLKVLHLGLHGFGFCDTLDTALDILLRACTCLRSVHVVHCRFVCMRNLLTLLSLKHDLKTLAVLGGASFIPDTLTGTGPDAARPLTQPCNIYLHPESVSKLLLAVVGSRPEQNQLNLVRLPVFRENEDVEVLLAHGIPFLQNAMSCVRSVEMNIIYGAPPDELTKMLDIFRQVPMLQLTFQCEGDILKTLAKIFRNTALDRLSTSQTLVLAPRSAGNDTPAESWEWALVDAALAKPHHTALAKVVLFIDVDADPDSMALPRLEAQGLLSVERREFGLNLWDIPLPWVAQRDGAAVCL